MKIGLFGGSFNPIHNGHLQLINKILRKSALDEVLIIPCGEHAFEKNLADKKHRIDMINLAIKDNPKIRLNKIEINSRGKSYTIDTVKKLKSKYDHYFDFIIGSDILMHINKWKKSKQLLREISFIVIRREGYSIKKVKGMNIDFSFVEKEDNISSTKVRENILKGKSISKLVPKDVENYIIKNELYKKE